MDFRIPLALVMFCGALPATAAGSADTAAMMERHLRAVIAADLDTVMKDYADDAVLVAQRGMGNADGLYPGKARVREFFRWISTPENKPALKTLTATTETVLPDLVLMRWTQFKGTPQQVSGTDVFVIRNGRIVFQAIRPDPKP